MATLEELQEQVRAEVEEAKPLTKVIVSGNQQTEVELTDDEYEAKIISQANNLFDIQENGYKTARQEAYGDLASQLDMQYWDSVNNTTTWKDHIAQVKADNPKPSA
jgi:FKBP-type peptidyl-prolyl cis-trans isomerase (trigger factor)